MYYRVYPPPLYLLSLYLSTQLEYSAFLPAWDCNYGQIIRWVFRFGLIECMYVCRDTMMITIVLILCVPLSTSPSSSYQRTIIRVVIKRMLLGKGCDGAMKGGALKSAVHTCSCHRKQIQINFLHSFLLLLFFI